MRLNGRNLNFELNESRHKYYQTFSPKITSQDNKLACLRLLDIPAQVQSIRIRRIAYFNE